LKKSGLPLSNVDQRRWTLVARSEPRISWLDRAELVSHLLRPTDTVCDLGSGAQTLRRFLPASTGYIPVDLVKEHPDTWVTDLNGAFLLPQRDFNVIACMGLFCHLQDVDAFFTRLLETQRDKLFICTMSAGRKPNQRSLEQCTEFLQQYMRGTTLFARHRTLCIFYGTLGAREADVGRRSVNELVCSYTPAWQYAAHRSDLALRRWRRGGNNGPRFARPVQA
jgi:hypothetical protein